MSMDRKLTGHDKGMVGGVKSVVALMEHVAKKKDGTINLKILSNCTLPFSGVAVVDVTLQVVKVVKMAPGVMREDLRAKTGVQLY